MDLPVNTPTLYFKSYRDDKMETTTIEDEAMKGNATSMLTILYLLKSIYCEDFEIKQDTTNFHYVIECVVPVYHLNTKSWNGKK